jgi:hypothetical protein
MSCGSMIVMTLHQPRLLHIDHEPSPELRNMQLSSHQRLKQAVTDITQLASQLINLDLVKFCPTNTYVWNYL